MAVWISINDIQTDVLYGLLIGRAFVHRVTKEKGKDWSLSFYDSEKGRRRGMFYHQRNYLGSEFLTFEIKTIDLFKQSKLVVISPREINVKDEELKHLFPKEGRR